MSGSFGLKSLKTVITLDSGEERIIEGLACSATIRKPGFPAKNSLDLSVWGLSYENMAHLSSLSFLPGELQINSIEIHAGELDSRLALVFQGEITRAWADFNSAPDPVMKFEAKSGDLDQMRPSAPLTTRGEAEAARLFAIFAAEAGYAYSNQGVTAAVSNAHFAGSPVDKARKLARDIGCELILDDGLMLTLPRGKARNGQPVLLSADTGLLGYPDFSQDGIRCRCLYHPALEFGGGIEVRSVVPKASGFWKITGLTHFLSANMPGGGPWESLIEAVYCA